MLAANSKVNWTAYDPAMITLEAREMAKHNAALIAYEPTDMANARLVCIIDGREEVSGNSMGGKTSQ